MPPYIFNRVRVLHLNRLKERTNYIPLINKDFKQPALVIKEKSRIIMQMNLDLPKVCGKLEMDLDFDLEEGPQI